MAFHLLIGEIFDVDVEQVEVEPGNWTRSNDVAKPHRDVPVRGCRPQGRIDE